MVDSAAKSLLQVKAGNLKVYAVTDKPRRRSQPQCRGYGARADNTCANGCSSWRVEIPTREQQTPEALAAHHKAETERWWVYR